MPGEGRDLRLLRYVEGQLTPAERAEVEVELDGSATAQLMVAELARLYGDAEVSTTVAEGRPVEPSTYEDDPAVPPRYEVREQLGMGGMGVVLGAHDRELARPVAIKLLLAVEQDEQGHARLRREAQALAQLSHPNVVQIYDVGEHQGRLYLAMEWIAGATLRQWRWQQSRTTTQVVQMYLQAGQGLAAAHRHGLVHRDFKPGNVLVGDDGRARVLDFGLARHGDAQPEDNPFTAPSTNDRPRPPADPEGSETLTRTGWVMGTPAYMAPEQAEGAPVGPACDQFSFCVALHEALLGWRPSSYGVREPAPPAASPPRDEPLPVPERTMAAIERGLSRAAEDRWPDMDALLAELRASVQPDRARARWLAAGGLVVALGAGAAALALPEARTPLEQSVEPQDPLLPDEPERRQAAVRLREALAEVETLRLAGQREEALARARAQRAEAETLGHAPLIAAVELAEGQALVANGLVMEARAPLEHAFFEARAVGMHALAIECARELVPVVRQLDPSHEDVEQWTDQLCAAANTAGDREAQAQCEVDRGRLELVRARAQPALERMEALLPTLADGANTRARIQGMMVRADALVRLGRLDEGEAAYDEIVVAERARSGPDGPSALRVQTVRASLLLRQGKFAQAKERLDALIEGIERVRGPEHPDVARALANRALALESLGQTDGALVDQQRALAIFERSLGPRSATVARVLGNLGQLHLVRGELDPALEALGRGLEIAVERHDESHPMVAQYHSVMGNALALADRNAEAVSHLERALRVQEQVLGPEHLRVAETCAGLGPVYAALGRTEQGEASLRRALKIRQEQGQARHTDTAQNHVSVARLLRHADRPSEGFEQAQLALAIYEEQVEPDSALPRVALYELAANAHAMGRYADAARYGRRVVELCVNHQLMLREPAARLVLAKALWDGRIDRAQAVVEAERARDGAAANGDDETWDEAGRVLRRFGHSPGPAGG